MTTPLHTRRTVLAGTGAAVGATSLGVLGAVPADARRGGKAAAGDRDVFAHGVASGDPEPTGVVLWTRVTPTPEATPGSGRGPRVTVRWEVARDADFRDVVRSGSFQTSPGRDHTVKVDAQGLAPDSWYFFRFHLRDATSRVGRTRTAPAAGATPDNLRVGVVSCSHFEAGHFAAYGHLARRDDLDAVLHLGDYLYEYAANEKAVRQHFPDREIVALADYRQRHAQYKTDPHLQDLHARLPFVTIWDDHEVTNDSYEDGAENHQPDTEGDYLRRRARAHRAYDEWMPVRLDGTARLGDGTRLFRRVRWGTLAELTMLDLRTYRDRMVETAAPFPLPQLQTEADDEDRTITGDEQMAWLKESLASSASQWKLVGNSVMIAPLSTAQLPEETVTVIHQVTGESPRDGVPINVDQWDGYTADRRELFDHIASTGITDTVFLTGDIHSGWACDLPLDTGAYPIGGTAGVEFVCTSVTSSNIDDITGAPPRTATRAIEATLMANNRHIKHINFDDHGYSVLDVTPERAQMDWFVLADKTDPDSAAAWETSWATATGSGSVARADGPVG
ncbi:alkaline phosphatase D family protein [Nocardioides sp. GCM10027113]|uniref:alkaline phosphatase D family protein n=1 Tax=unclassified Nocardioides TaxID=2615069 RepID=UPI0036179404